MKTLLITVLCVFFGGASYAGERVLLCIQGKLGAGCWHSIIEQITTVDSHESNFLGTIIDYATVEPLREGRTWAGDLVSAVTREKEKGYFIDFTMISRWPTAPNVFKEVHYSSRIPANERTWTYWTPDKGHCQYSELAFLIVKNVPVSGCRLPFPPLKNTEQGAAANP